MNHKSVEFGEQAFRSVFDFIPDIADALSILS
jgi:hypothetical protein